MASTDLRAHRLAHGLADSGDPTILEVNLPPESGDPEPTIVQVREEVQVQVCGYGDDVSGLNKIDRHAIVEWLKDCFNWIGYHGAIHVVWYKNADTITILKAAMIAGVRNREPVFLYRCATSMSLAPEGYYWSQMEHPSRSLFQLELVHKELTAARN
jgi:hypothetical protein